MQLSLGAFTVYMLMLVNSSPEIVQYTPPTDCSTPNVWGGVTLTLTVTINGTQYPRLAFFTFHNVEIWRSSTPIPDNLGSDGIVWTYVKDVTRFIPLFSKPGTFILQLDNDIQPEARYNGEYAALTTIWCSHVAFRRGGACLVLLVIDDLGVRIKDFALDPFQDLIVFLEHHPAASPSSSAPNSGAGVCVHLRRLSAVTLEVTIFSGSSRFPPAQRADLIVPLTTLANDTGDEASVPPGFSVEVTLPQNAVTAFAELQVSASDSDTFWYYNVPNQFLSYFPTGTVGKNGPFREVRVLVDGQVAGVAFPYAFLSTGSAVPPAWRPIASYGALDMPTYHLDLTPFIPILTNGQPHNITLDVSSVESDHQINQNWYLSGLLQVNLDSSTLPTTGNITLYQADDYALSTASGSNDSDINIIVNASRSIHIEAEIIAGSGEQTKVVFTQDLEYGNVQNYPPQNLDQQHAFQIFQIASGETISTHNGETALQDTFTYPFLLAFTPPGSADVIDRAYDRVLLPAPFIMGTTIIEHQVAAGTEKGETDGWNGTNNNTFNYIDTEGNTYTRQVNASSNAITFDNQGGTLAPKAGS
ncbi:peptide N-acetyl-beta-D-glucosaminyl asparaginase amidase A-domain-containing protein [Lactarius sanguifluus]|nr:peptide N-acetyl-beta-D-glucosaminyl asparaginase amidase A-domain-containing protein [Lactarius sanguifluus]